MSDGIWKLPPVPTVVFAMAHGTHLSRIFFACASPVCWYSAATRSRPHAWKPNHRFYGGSC